MGDNRLLIALALMERTVPMLKADKREQLNRVNLQVILQNLNQASTKIVEVGIDDLYVTGNILSAIECIETMLENEGVSETDTETKDILIEKVNDALVRLYLATGKYYTTNEFNYTMRLVPLLERIVDECLNQNYYFGIAEV